MRAFLKQQNIMIINKEWIYNPINIVSNLVYIHDKNYKGKSRYDKKKWFILSYLFEA